MQKTQQLIVIIGIVLIFLMSLYPPWVYVDDDSKTQHHMGYGPIWKPPVDRQRDTAELFGIKLQLNVQTRTANTIDLFRLIMQIAVVFTVAGGSVVLLRRASA